MKELQRTKVGDFMICDAIDFDKVLETANAKEMLENKIITVEKLFEKENLINLDNRKLELFLNGVQLTFKLQDGVYRIYNNSKFVGLGKVTNGLLKRDVII